MRKSIRRRKAATPCESQSKKKKLVLKNPSIEKLWELEHAGWKFVSAIGDGSNSVYTYTKD